MAEWLRRWTRNPLGSPRAGSNPADYVFFFPSAPFIFIFVFCLFVCLFVFFFVFVFFITFCLVTYFVLTAPLVSSTIF